VDEAGLALEKQHKLLEVCETSTDLSWWRRGTDRRSKPIHDMGREQAGSMAMKN
jgi:hypothetical protein